MKLSKDTWHARNWEAWLRYSTSKKRGEFKERFHDTLYDINLDDYPHEYLSRFIVKERVYKGETAGTVFIGTYELWEPPARQPNLCIYFWVAILRGPFWRTSKWLGRHQNIALSLTIFFLIAIPGTIYNILDDGSTALWIPYAFIAGFIAAVTAFIGLMAGVSILVDNYLYPWIRNRAGRENDQEPEPNIIIEHIRAKKSKVCPIIEFKE